MVLWHIQHYISNIAISSTFRAASPYKFIVTYLIINKTKIFSMNNISEYHFNVVIISKLGMLINTNTPENISLKIKYKDITNNV